MDVVVVGARMHGIALQDRLEHGHDLERVRPRLAVGRPELPRMEVHEALGVHRRRVEVVGVPRRERLHRRRVVARELRLVGRGGIRDVTHRQRLHVRALVLGSARGKRQRLLDLGAGLLQPIGLGRLVVVVGAERERHAPVRHRGFRIELGRALERAERLLVVEAEEQRQALVEVLLRLGARSLDRVAVRAHPAEQLRRLFRRGRVRVRGVLGTEHRGDAGEGNREQDSFHGPSSGSNADSISGPCRRKIGRGRPKLSG